MTTIAVNQKEMACDLQATYGGSVKFKIDTKIIELEPHVSKELFGVKKALIGFCGSIDTWGEVNGWFSNPTNPPPKCKGLEMIMLTDKKEIYHATNLVNWTLIKEKSFSIGSGMQFAVTALAMGKSPLEACKMAGKFDPSTGMGYKSYKI